MFKMFTYEVKLLDEEGKEKVDKPKIPKPSTSRERIQRKDGRFGKKNVNHNFRGSTIHFLKYFSTTAKRITRLKRRKAKRKMLNDLNHYFLNHDKLTYTDSDINLTKYSDINLTKYLDINLTKYSDINLTKYYHKHYKASKCNVEENKTTNDVANSDELQEIVIIPRDKSTKNNIKVNGKHDNCERINSEYSADLKDGDARNTETENDLIEIIVIPKDVTTSNNKCITKGVSSAVDTDDRDNQLHMKGMEINNTTESEGNAGEKENQGDGMISSIFQYCKTLFVQFW